MRSTTLLSHWMRAPSADYVQRVKAMVDEVKASLKTSDSRTLQRAIVFLHGSLKNNTSTLSGTDIDLGVLSMLPMPSPSEVLESSSTESFHTHYISFKMELEEALVASFSRTRVRRENKTLRITRFTERDHADITPFLPLCIDSARASLRNGVVLWPDDSNQPIQNWPFQHHVNGIRKNKHTALRYKRFVRILKCLSAQMTIDGLDQRSVPGFLLECLAWNTPDQLLTKGDYNYGTQALLDHILRYTEETIGCVEWTEVSQQKLLFDRYQKWQCHDAHIFATQAINYLKLAW